MGSPLLATKFHVPAKRATFVPRRRLTERLDLGAAARLTLVSAPAGFGKTTLLADWLCAAAAGGRAVAWLSLDQRDNDPAVFWTYVIAAVRKAVPELGEAGAVALAASPADGAAIVGGLTADLDAVEHDLVLVLDDYHLIDATAIQDGLAFLIDRLPPRIQLVVGTRADPRLPLARLRGRGDLVEIRATDLRFTAEEVAAYLTGAMGLALTAHDVTALEGRTEGWIVALQLAALSLQGREDAAGFIETFAGDDRFVVDYLVEEVLHLQTESVRRFLLQTSILSRLTGPLCDAVTGDTDGAAMLETLERTNLFVVPLDDQRRWYRYHHLFADMLTARLRDEAPTAIPSLHRRASDWYAGEGNLPAAVRHAMLCDDPTRTAELVELAAPTMFRDREEATVRGWLDALPRDVITSRPALAIHFVGAHVASGDFEGIEPYLDAAERVLALETHAEHAAPVDPILRMIPGMVFAYRAAIAQSRGDMAGAAAHARRAFELADADDHLARGAAAGLAGLASWTIGDLVAARESWTQAVASLDRADHAADAMGGSIALGDILAAQGHLADAVDLFTSRLARVAATSTPAIRGVGDMHVGLARLLCERGDVAAAKEHLDAERALGEAAGMPQNPYRSRVAAAYVAWAEADLTAAAHLLDDAERVYAGDFFPNVRPIPAMRARVWISQGREVQALAWARGRGLGVDDDLSYLSEYEHVTLALALVAQGSKPRADAALADAALSDAALSGTALVDAARLLARLRLAAEAGSRTGSVIEILVVEVLAQQAIGDTAAALGALRRAVTLAEPGHYIRTFANVGDALVAPLKAMAKEGSAPEYVRQLLAAIGSTTGVSSDVQRRGQGVFEPLSDRELDVLRMLRSDLTGPEIARVLFVSVNTLRTHTKSIFTKLGVNNRRAAVRVADELGLVSRTPPA